LGSPLVGLRAEAFNAENAEEEERGWERPKLSTRRTRRTQRGAEEEERGWEKRAFEAEDAENAEEARDR
jgi:hypothetical protein